MNEGRRGWWNLGFQQKQAQHECGRGFIALLSAPSFKTKFPYLLWCFVFLSTQRVLVIVEYGGDVGDNGDGGDGGYGIIGGYCSDDRPKGCW